MVNERIMIHIIIFFNDWWSTVIAVQMHDAPTMTYKEEDIKPVLSSTL